MWLYCLSSVYTDKFLTATANYNYFQIKELPEADISMIIIFLWILWKTAADWVGAKEEEGEDKAQDHTESVPCQGSLGGLSWSSAHSGWRQPASQSAVLESQWASDISPDISQNVPFLLMGVIS